ncbi:DUF6538 domain-containing protein [Maliponia aquimaris]|uniref:Phage integrase family protein n=1 Tax=Maliponia aquimaris TaxID=1673631 RepID=A0A238L4C4_9RHOB|nr:DUF6538 domain-containing protein [Maliponia aquimaris]SMX49914.1 Phage integrase family protein [Maliponia aquimaris]
MSNKTSPLSDGLELRGRMYYARFRVPTRFCSVEPRREVNKSLKTRDRRQARVKLEQMRTQLELQWETLLAEKEGRSTIDSFIQMTNFLESLSLPFRPLQKIVSGPLEDMLARIEKIENFGTTSEAVPAVLGARQLPDVKVSEMADLMKRHHATKISRKNAYQTRAWVSKYERAAASFIEVVEDKPISQISEANAMAFKKHWLERLEKTKLTANYVNKQIRHFRQMIDTYYEMFGVPMSERRNSFEGMNLKNAGSFSNDEGTKLPLPSNWVQRVVSGYVFAGLDKDPQAQDIAIVVAQTGARQSEICDLPPHNIVLDHPIPHVIIGFVNRDDFKSEIKNKASERVIPLVGPALDAMRRNPKGFPKYRGKGTISNEIGRYLRDNNLFPAPTDAEKAEIARRAEALGRSVNHALQRPFTFGSTRHTFEDRMLALGFTNEERAYMMGHSLTQVRGRPVYGSGPDVALRALYMELVSYPTDTWSPRPSDELWAKVDAHLLEMGFELRRPRAQAA